LGEVIIRRPTIRSAIEAYSNVLNFSPKKRNEIRATHINFVLEIIVERER
jgi:hypothetical protein